MAAKSQDKILFGAALLVLLASAGWMALEGSKLASIRSSNDATLPSKAYAASGVDASIADTPPWPKPGSQSSGALWTYNVFTPPEIYYSETEKKFTVTAPYNGPETPPPPPAPFGLELVQVKQDAFRLQLVGYVGEGAEARGTFENALTGETVIGKAGKQFPSLGLKIKSFEVKRSVTMSKESMPVYDTEATAVIVDVKTGEEVKLTNKQRYIKGTPLAVLRADGTGETTEHKADTKFTVGTTTYTVVTVTAEPPSAEIVKESSELKEPVTKTLTPSSSIAPVAPALPAPEQAAPPATTPSTPFPFGT